MPGTTSEETTEGCCWRPCVMLGTLETRGLQVLHDCPKTPGAPTCPSQGSKVNTDPHNRCRLPRNTRTAPLQSGRHLRTAWPRAHLKVPALWLGRECSVASTTTLNSSQPLNTWSFLVFFSFSSLFFNYYYYFRSLLYRLLSLLLPLG